MKTKTWTEIICDDCNALCYGAWVWGRNIPIREFRREAAKKQWQPLSNGAFRCPKCIKLKKLIRKRP